MGPAFLLPYLGCPPSSLPVCHHYGSEGLPKEKGRARREPQASPGGCSAPARDVEGSQAEALPACSGALPLLTAESASPPGRPRPLLEGPAPRGRPRPSRKAPPPHGPCQLGWRSPLGEAPETLPTKQTWCPRALWPGRWFCGFPDQPGLHPRPPSASGQLVTSGDPRCPPNP